ncbi:MAG: hypothetical protein WCI91_01085 [Candidatus Nomurabacteria bacterium]
MKNFFKMIISFLPAICFIMVYSSIGSIAINIVNHNHSGIINSFILGVVFIAIMKIASRSLNAN